MNEPIITIIMQLGKFEYLGRVLNSHKDLIHKLGVSDLVKDSLIKDTDIIIKAVSKVKKGV